MILACDQVFVEEVSSKRPLFSLQPFYAHELYDVSSGDPENQQIINIQSKYEIENEMSMRNLPNVKSTWDTNRIGMV